MNQRGESARKVIAEKGFSFTFLETHVGNDDPVKAMFNISGVPVNYFINEDGYIIYKKYGFKRGDEKLLEEKVNQLLSK